jgi:hypothetical protein
MKFPFTKYFAIFTSIFIVILGYLFFSERTHEYGLGVIMGIVVFLSVMLGLLATVVRKWVFEYNHATSVIAAKSDNTSANAQQSFHKKPTRIQLIVGLCLLGLFYAEPSMIIIVTFYFLIKLITQVLCKVPLPWYGVAVVSGSILAALMYYVSPLLYNFVFSKIFSQITYTVATLTNPIYFLTMYVPVLIYEAYRQKRGFSVSILITILIVHIIISSGILLYTTTTYSGETGWLFVGTFVYVMMMLFNLITALVWIFFRERCMHNKSSSQSIPKSDSEGKKYFTP